LTRIIILRIFFQTRNEKVTTARVEERKIPTNTVTILVSCVKKQVETHTIYFNYKASQ